MSLPLETLRSQLDAAYVALETIERDRAKWRTEARMAQQARVEEASNARDAYETVVASLGNIIARLSQGENERADLVARLKQTLSERAALQDAVSEARDQLADVQRQIEAMQASSSWRMTKAIRRVGQHYRALPELLAVGDKLVRVACIPLLLIRQILRATLNTSLDLLTGLASECRARFGTPRTMWGVTPILTLPLLAKCDRLLGLRSESLVFSTYYISKDFDINLHRVCEKIYTKYPRLASPLHDVIFRLALIRYDVFHLFCDRSLHLPVQTMEINPGEMDAIKHYGRRLYSYTYGADVRTREATLALGRYNLCAECPEPKRFCICDDSEGQRNVTRIRERANAMLAMGDMLTYVPGARDLHFWPIDLANFPNIGTSWTPGRPLRIAHAPNHPHFKGTRYLTQALDRLQAEGFAIELVMIQGVPNSEVIALFKSCDLIADQFIAGFHGYTALEAMALGKPVLCYLRGPSMAIDPDNCPVINVWPDTIYDTLRDCLEGRIDLAALGERSRSYVEHYYSLEAVAVRLGQLYIETANFPPRISRQINRRIVQLERSLPVLLKGVPPVPWILVSTARAAEGTSPPVEPNVDAVSNGGEEAQPVRKTQSLKCGAIQSGAEAAKCDGKVSLDNVPLLSRNAGRVKGLLASFIEEPNSIRASNAALQQIADKFVFPALSAPQRVRHLPGSSPQIAMIVYSDLRIDPRVYREARALVDAGFGVKVIYPDGMSTDDASAVIDFGPGVEFRPLPISAANYLSHFPHLLGGEFLEALSEERPFAIHCHDLSTALVGLAAAGRLNIPCICDFHEWYSENVSWDYQNKVHIPHPPHVREAYRVTERIAMSRAAAVITVCESIATELESNFARGRRKVHVIRNIPPARRSPTRAYKTLREELGIAPNMQVVLWQGGTGPTRLLEPVIESLAHYERFVLIIRGPSLDMFGADYRRIAERLNVSHRLYLEPPVPSEDVVEAAKGADCGVWTLPNLCKNFFYALPNKIFEYLYAGVPLLAADYPEVRRLVETYQIGLLFDPYNARSIASAIRQLNEEPGLATAMRSRIPKVIAELDTDREWQKLVTIYQVLARDGSLKNLLPVGRS